MDIEPKTMGGRKTLDLIQKNDIENRHSIDGTDQLNKSSFFENLYFWSIFLLSASFFIDLTFYFCYYQHINNQEHYQSRTFFIRIICDALFISPLLLYIRFALNSTLKTYILGIIIFLPQFILNLISIIDIHAQDFSSKNKNVTNTTDDSNSTQYLNNTFIYNTINILLNDIANDAINDTTNDTNIDTTNTTTNETINTITDMRINILKISSIFNMIIYIITFLLTYLRVYKNKN